MEQARRIACVDASVCIAFQRLNLLEVVPQLFDSLLVPVGVLQELVNGIHLDNAWMIARCGGAAVVRPGAFAGMRLPAALRGGDREVIGIAVQRQCIALLDDGPARKAARALGLQVHGTLGLLLAAKHRRFIVALRPLLEHLLQTGFRLDEQLVSRVLVSAGEE